MRMPFWPSGDETQTNETPDQMRQALFREVSSLKELMDTRFVSITTRLEAMDKAVDVFSANLTRVPTDVDKQVGNLRAYHDQMIVGLRTELIQHFGRVDEQFKSVETQFQLRDKSVEQTAKDGKVAIDAALLAQKDAAQQTNRSFADQVDKADKNTTKQIDLLALSVQQGNNAYDARMTELRERVTKLESQLVAAVASQASSVAAQAATTAAAQQAVTSSRTDVRDSQTVHQQSNSWTLSLAIAGFSIFFGLSAFIVEIIRITAGK